MELLKPGTLFADRYEIVSQIGHGGMGSIYKAKELDLNRFVALKILHTGLLQDEDSLRRMEREAKVIAALNHRNILIFYRFGVWAKHAPYIAMEHLEGRSLRSLLDEQGKLGVDRCISLALQVCDAMAYAHQHGIVHRDLTPNNIMLVADPEPDTVKIIDFGLARLLPSSGQTNQHLTQTGVLIGSVFYMSPEQCLGKKSDCRSDIYSLGCVLYEALTGKPPLTADNPIGLMHKHVNEQPEPLYDVLPRSSRVEALNAILRKAMAKQPDERYQTMEVLAADLSRIKSDSYAEIMPAAGNSKRLSVICLAAIGLATVGSLIGYLSLSKKPVASEESGRPVRLDLEHGPVGLSAQFAQFARMAKGPEKSDLAMKLEKRLLTQREDVAPLMVMMLYNFMSKDLAERGKGKESAAVWERCLKYLESNKGDPRFIDDVYFQLGREYLKEANYQEAEKCFNKCLAMRAGSLSNDGLTARTFMSLGIASEEQNRNAEAAMYLEKALALAPFDQFSELFEAPRLSVVYLKLGQFDKEKRLYKSFQKCLSKAKPAEVVSAYHFLVQNASRFGLKDEAFQRCQDCLGWLKDKGDNSATVQALLMKANTEKRFFEFEQALKTYEQADTLARKTHIANADRAQILGCLASCLVQTKRLPEARQNFELALSYAKAPLHKLHRPQLLTELISVLIAQGDEDAVNKYMLEFEREVRPLRYRDAERPICNYYRHITGAYLKAGQKEKARHLLRQFAILARENSYPAAVSSRTLAGAITNMDVLTKEDVESFVRPGLTALTEESLEAKDREAQVFHKYAEYASRNHEEKQAERFVLEQLDKVKTKANPQLTQAWLLNVADFYCFLGLRDRAEILYRQAAAFASSQVGESNSLLAVLALGQHLLDLHNPEKAVETLKPIAPLVEKFRKSSDGLSQELWYRSQLLQANALAMQRKYEDSRKIYLELAHLSTKRPQQFDAILPLIGLADSYELEHKYEKSQEYIKQAQKLVLLGHANQFPALTLEWRYYKNLWSSGHRSEAYAGLEKLLQKHRELGYAQPEAAYAHELMGHLRAKDGDTKKAEEYYLKAIQICTDKLGANHPLTKKTQAQYSHACKK